MTAPPFLPSAFVINRCQERSQGGLSSGSPSKKAQSLAVRALGFAPGRGPLWQPHWETVGKHVPAGPHRAFFSYLLGWDFQPHPGAASPGWQVEAFWAFSGLPWSWRV